MLGRAFLVRDGRFPFVFSPSYLVVNMPLLPFFSLRGGGGGDNGNGRKGPRNKRQLKGKYLLVAAVLSTQ